MPSALKILRSENSELNRVQDFTRAAITPLLASAIVNGLLLGGGQELNGSPTVANAGLALASGANTIKHGLGRTPKGWLPVRILASATFYETKAPDAQYLYLTASVAATVFLWVF